MSEILATSPRLDGEADSVEGRIADFLDVDDIEIGGYKLSENDKRVVQSALRSAAMTCPTTPKSR